MFITHYKLNGVSASGLRLCKQTSPTIHFYWARNSISKLAFIYFILYIYIYHVVYIQKWEFLLAHACVYPCPLANQYSQNKGTLSNSGTTLRFHANKNCSGKLNYLQVEKVDMNENVIFSHNNSIWPSFLFWDFQSLSVAPELSDKKFGFTSQCAMSQSIHQVEITESPTHCLFQSWTSLGTR